jgi:xanthine dehydrogenase accessory factor
MLCGGSNEIFFELLEATETNIQVFRHLSESRIHGKWGFLVTALDLGNGKTGSAERFLITDDSSSPGACTLSRPLLKELVENARKVNTSVMITIENRRYVIEPFIVPKIVYLFGAGHISKQVALLADMVNFQVSVLDDREEFANKHRFREAQDIKVLSSFENAFSTLLINQNSFIVIVTRGHVHDKTVLIQALKSKAGYIGMIGSRKKRDAIYASLLNHGFTNNDLERVHSPIGLEIKADTPEEIGISIVAELVQVRAGMA